MLAILLAVVSLLLPVHGERLRFVVVGDTGGGSAAVAKGIAALHARSPLDAIVITGDNVYPCGVKSASDPKWSVVRPLSALGIPLYPVLGNHDYCGNPDAQVGAPLPNWNLPAREFTLRSKLADFAFIDTTPIARGTRAPKPLSFGDAPWRIVVGHHTVVSSGYHGYLPRDEHTRMRQLIAPMRNAKVDLYLCGHDHHLELLRTNPLMLVSGAGSEPIVPVMRHGSTLFPDQTTSYRGFAVVELTKEQMTIRFYDADGKARSKVFTFPRKQL
ncbi:MAG: tartrate-resistant acid phosphatase type 5 [Acidobacteriota bacterium]|jgi:acid phosphatase|nr:tartrate-resistant acid phosphatase type 5 [Acidobacteriota bacterium]